MSGAGNGITREQMAVSVLANAGQAAFPFAGATREMGAPRAPWDMGGVGTTRGEAQRFRAQAPDAKRARPTWPVGGGAGGKGSGGGMGDISTRFAEAQIAPQHDGKEEVRAVRRGGRGGM
jgi:hypothetical protein